MWQCICTLFAGNAKTETSCYRWKSIGLADHEHKDKVNQIINAWKANPSVQNSGKAFQVVLEQGYMYRVKEPQRHHARLIESASGQEVAEAGVGDNITGALDELLLCVQRPQFSPPEYR